ncbi:MAG: hypothetical protein ACRD1Z_14855 [Vicinamibacteria bacterium]
MGAVTYPDERVEALLSTSFCCVRLDIAQREPDARELIRMARPLWTPTLLFLDPRGIEVRRVVGYLPPEQFLAEAQIALGLVDLLHARNGEACDRFSKAADGDPRGHAAPEALFWAGIAAYRKEGRDRAVLAREWSQLWRRYPESTWWSRADVFGVEESSS